MSKVTTTTKQDEQYLRGDQGGMTLWFSSASTTNTHTCIRTTPHAWETHKHVYITHLHTYTPHTIKTKQTNNQTNLLENESIGRPEEME